MELKVFGKGFNYSQDGPGNRLVYHLKGCNMHCPWCSNPEGMHPEKGDCYTVTVEEILSEAIISKPMFFDDGGVTFTGGEATLQFEALSSLLSNLQEAGISTAIETNGTSKNLPLLFNKLDYLIMDFKHPDSNVLKKITGVENTVIKSNIITAAKSNINLLIRIPLIGGFNTAPKDFEGFLEFFKTVKGENVKIELLKYHEYGKDKWEKCGLEYSVKDAFVSEEVRCELEEKLKSIGLNVVRT